MLMYSNVRRLLPIFLFATLILLLVGLSSGAALSDASSATSELVTVGESHSCALKPNGSIDCWEEDFPQSRIDIPAGFFYQVSAGGFHTCGLTTAGVADCWGMNTSGQAEDKAGPFLQVSAGSDYTCALTGDGAAECWGNNAHDKATAKTGPFTHISAGVDHTCAVKESGSIECWGLNIFGQANNKAGSYTQVSVGEAHTCALASNGAVDCWGLNNNGQAAGKNGPYTMVSAGSTFTCALSTTGIDCWGVSIPGLDVNQAGSFTQISVDKYHMCALKANGGIDCWVFDSETPTNHPGPYGKYIPETALGAPLPPALTNIDDASFSFSSPDPAATFECRLDSGNWAACASPKAYTNLPDGAHTFRARAVSPPGNVDITPPSHTWTIDTAPPDTTITAKPPALTNSPDAIFQFSSEPGATFECRLDDVQWTTCASPKNYTDLDDGDHSFDVRATDPAGNVDPAPATAKWTIDATPPEVMITEAPSGVTDQTTATIAFTGEAGVAFRCRLDNLVEIEPCASPQEFTNLAEGGHTFTVWAVDNAGNEASDSAAWIVSFDKLTFLPFIAR